MAIAIKEAAPAPSAIKDRVQITINARRETFIRLAHEIHEHPELAFAETFAAQQIGDLLALEGFLVQTGIAGLRTAFAATAGSGELRVAFCAEYDALDEGIGHGCGHNLIAGAAVAAAVGLKDVAGELDLTVSVIGTPGEELLGLKDPLAGHLVSGKIVLLEAGVFDGVHAVLMVHPGPSPYSEFAPTVAGVRIQAQFSEAPPGRALDATWALKLERALGRAIAFLHQTPYYCRVAPEGVEAGARADLCVAAASLAEVLSAVEPVRRCLEQAAADAGVTVEITEFTPNAELHNDPRLSAAFRANSEALGRRRESEAHIQAEVHYVRNELIRRALRDPRQLVAMLGMAQHPAVGLFLDKPPVHFMWGTDLGQVSHFIPAIHPLIGIGGTAPNYTAAFTPQADTDEAYRAMVDGAIALAQTAVDAAMDRSLRTYLLEGATRRRLTNTSL
jgi:metal-dependent amidase/aminoacylase/carboxypeptidase family protein